MGAGSMESIVAELEPKIDGASVINQPELAEIMATIITMNRIVPIL